MTWSTCLFAYGPVFFVNKKEKLRKRERDNLKSWPEELQELS